MRTLLRCLALLVLFIALEDSGDAYYQITAGNARLEWATLPVSYVLQQNGSDDIDDDSEFLAVVRAFDAWEELSNSTIAFSEDLTADSTRTDYTASDIHLIWFDENDDSGFFGGASGTVAVTPILFDTVSGQILDADIIFNGDDHTFSSDGSPSTFDVQSVATHEIGHFLGLDHAGSCASTMFPFAETGRTVARSLAADDVAGAERIYSGGGSVGDIVGRVVRTSDGANMAGAHVVAMDSNGLLAASTYSQTDGTFTIERVAPGTYTVFAEPLDGPVTGANLSSSVGATADTDFSTTFLGGNGSPSSVVVTAGTSINIGSLNVGAAITPNLSIVNDYPFIGVRGASTTIMVLGGGFAGGDGVSVSGTGVTVDSTTFLNLVGMTGFVIDLTVAANATLGPRNVEIATGVNELVLATGALEIYDPAPTLTLISPNTGLATGAEAVSIQGTGFVPGALIRIGDAPLSAVTVVSPTEISGTTSALSSGTLDVIVQNPDGQVAVLGSAFTVISQPVITTIFPNLGSIGGGTAVKLSGAGFVTGATVTVGGTSATVTNLTSNSLSFTSPSGPAGAADVVVTNPGGLSAISIGGFTYVASPDPSIASVSPSSGPIGGGTVLTILGSNFVNGATVILGQAPDGSGGKSATSVTLVSSSELRATTPSASAGATAVTVANPSGNSFRLAGAFTYTAPAGGGGGGGGGCFALIPMGPMPPDDLAGGLLPWFLLFAILMAYRRRAGMTRVRPGEKAPPDTNRIR